MISTEAILKAQVGRWGNSLAVRLPKTLTDRFGVVEGDELDLSGIEAALTEVAEADRIARKKAAIESLKSANWVLPPDWKIDRNDPDMRG